MKVAIVYDYLRMYGGGERMLELFHELFPDAPIYTSLFLPETVPPHFQSWDIRTSSLQTLPFKKKLYPVFVGLLPIAFESFDLSMYDVVLSISAGFAKGVITSQDTLHLSYTLTVPRFLWGYETSNQTRYKKNILLMILNNALRKWDKIASDRVDFFFANSKTVAKRIKKAYGKSSLVIPSPVDETKYQLFEGERNNSFLIVSRLESYKRIDLAIAVCTKYNYPLLVLGSGSEAKRLRKMAGSTILFQEGASDAEVIKAMQHAKALLFPGADDLGLVPIEAQLCGTPVIAFGKDGALETIMEGISGEFFTEQTEESLWQAIQRFESKQYNQVQIHEWALQFSYTSIKSALKSTIYDAYRLFSISEEVKDSSL